MTSRTEIELLRRAVALLVKQAQDEFAAFLPKLDLADPYSARDALLDVVPATVDVYADATADLAGDMYLNLREDAGIATPFTPVYTAPDLDAVEASTRWAAGGLFDPERDLAAAVDEVLDRHIKTGARATLIESAVVDVIPLPRQPDDAETLPGTDEDEPQRVRFARIPTGPTTCAFCVMLASRGAVYATRETAGDLDQWHAHCDCMIVPIFPGGALPDGYDPEHYKQVYAESLAAKREDRPVSRVAATASSAPAELPARQGPEAPNGGGGTVPPVDRGSGSGEPSDDEYPIRLLDGRPVPMRPSEAPVLTVSDERHVLWSDAKGGGHFWDMREPGKTEFPERWDEERVMYEVSEVLRDPQFARFGGFADHLSLYRISDEVLTYVALQREDNGSWRFVTAFPLNGRGVIRNDDSGGRDEVELDSTAWQTYPR